MKQITEETLIDYLLNKFPDFEPYWKEYCDSRGDSHGLYFDFIPFEDYTMDVISSKNHSLIKEIFDCMEFLLNNADGEVQNTIATGYLETILNRSDETNEVEFFKSYLGEESLGSINAWIEFCEKMDEDDKFFKSLSFKDGIILAYRMLHNKQNDKEIQRKAISILGGMQKYYPEEWRSSWKFEFLLGYAYDFICCNELRDELHFKTRCETRLATHRRASENVTPIPPSLLVHIAKCYDPLGKSPIGRGEAQGYLEEALEIEPTIEGAFLICKIFEEKKDLVQEAVYWKEVLEKAQKENLHIQNLLPEILDNITLDFDVH